MTMENVYAPKPCGCPVSASVPRRPRASGSLALFLSLSLTRSLQEEAPGQLSASLNRGFEPEDLGLTIALDRHIPLVVRARLPCPLSLSLYTATSPPPPRAGRGCIYIHDAVQQPRERESNFAGSISRSSSLQRRISFSSPDLSKAVFLRIEFRALSLGDSVCAITPLQGPTNTLADSLPMPRTLPTYQYIHAYIYALQSLDVCCCCCCWMRLYLRWCVGYLIDETCTRQITLLKHHIASLSLFTNWI